MTIRLRATLTLEYTANPTHYPEGSTPEEMAKIDGGDSYPSWIWEDENTVFEVKVVE